MILGWAIDNGITPPGDTEVLRNAVIFYMGLTVVSYLAARQQYILINRAGEGFLRDLRIRVFDHIQRQSLAFFDRNKSGVLVARMTADIESMGELVQWGLLQFVAAILLVGFALIAGIPDVVAAGAGGTTRDADHHRRVTQVPTRLQRGLPRRAREHRAEPLGSPGGHRRRPRHPGLRP